MPSRITGASVAATPKVSYNRSLGERWSAGLKARPMRCHEESRTGVEVLDRGRSRRDRQHRRRRHERIGRQVDAGADRAVVILAARARLRGEQRLRKMPGFGRRNPGWIAARNAFEMNVAKGDDELNGQRE
jgi:hypothetical protein